MTFVTRFRKHFQALILTRMRRQESTIDIDKYTLSLELHNLHYLKELLLADDNNIHLSSEELAVLAMLLDIKLIQLKQIHRYYAVFMDKVEEVCSLLNIQLCGKIYTNIAGYLYQQCKCQTFTAYIQNFFNSPCMEYFKCPVVQHLQDLYMSGMLHLSEDELSYVNLVASLHCYRNFFTLSKNGHIRLIFLATIIAIIYY